MCLQEALPSSLVGLRVEATRCACLDASGFSVARSRERSLVQRAGRVAPSNSSVDGPVQTTLNTVYEDYECKSLHLTRIKPPNSVPAKT